MFIKKHITFKGDFWTMRNITGAIYQRLDELRPIHTSFNQRAYFWAFLLPDERVGALSR